MIRKPIVSLLLTLFYLIPSTKVEAVEWDEQTYHLIEQSIQLPSIGDRTYAVTQHGASTQASAAQNQKAIQQALSKVADESSFLQDAPLRREPFN